MKVAFILNSADLGGANISLLTLISYLKEYGVESAVLLPETGLIERELNKMGCDYAIQSYRACVLFPHYRGIPWIVNWIQLPKLLRIFQKWNVDIIHTNSSTHDIGIILASILKKKHIWHVREALELHFHARYIFAKGYAKKMKKTDDVVCVSDFIYSLQKAKFGSKNLVRIYDPYEVEKYYDASHHFMLNGRLRLLCSGNITESKGQMEAVKAMKELRDRGNSNVTLTIIGSGDEQAINNIREYIIFNKLGDIVKILPFTTDIVSFQKNMDILVNCSVYEACPRVVIEAMLGGLLVIGNNTGGVAELIGKDERGLMYNKGDSSELADKIEYAMNNTSESERIIDKAQKWALKEFDGKKNTEKILHLYNECLNGEVI